MNITEQFLDEIRKHGNYKQLSKKAGIGMNTINFWLHHGVMPKLETAEKVLDAMGLELLIFEKEK